MLRPFPSIKSDSGSDEYILAMAITESLLSASYQIDPHQAERLSLNACPSSPLVVSGAIFSLETSN